jgi:eukaryotic-like serine/threonine-protein kinase
MLCLSCLRENLLYTRNCKYCGDTWEPYQNSAPMYFPLQLPPGTSLKEGSYEVKTTLGQGGFGITYSATVMGSNQIVAIKELLPEKCCRRGNLIEWPTQISYQTRREQIEEVRREAQFLSQCVHPNIVKIYDWFEENNTAYIVMQMAVGNSLTELLRQQKKMSEEKVKHYFIQVGEALKEIHSRNLLHRDINPNNIIIDDDDNVTLIDFGNAREFIAGQSRDMTRTITPGYAPLEQYSQRARRGPATDFYAVCATMYDSMFKFLGNRSMSEPRSGF